jgi:hypothetical protein
MRSVLVLPVALFVVFGTAAAQDTSSTPLTPSRWTLSAGPEFIRWSPSVHLWGMRLRAEYDLTRPNRVFGLRLEGAALWTPTQSYFFQTGSRTQGGVDQSSDIMLGLAASIAPFPRARVSPYVTLGVFGRQMWRQGSFFVQDPNLLSYDQQRFGYSRGDIIPTFGLGLRVRLGGRSFQLELRQIRDHGNLTFGTRLPF